MQILHEEMAWVEKQDTIYVYQKLIQKSKCVMLKQSNGHDVCMNDAQETMVKEGL